MDAQIDALMREVVDASARPRQARSSTWGRFVTGQNAPPVTTIPTLPWHRRHVTAIEPPEQVVGGSSHDKMDNRGGLGMFAWTVFASSGSSLDISLAEGPGAHLPGRA